MKKTTDRLAFAPVCRFFFVSDIPIKKAPCSSAPAETSNPQPQPCPDFEAALHNYRLCRLRKESRYSRKMDGPQSLQPRFFEIQLWESPLQYHPRFLHRSCDPLFPAHKANTDNYLDRIFPDVYYTAGYIKRLRKCHGKVIRELNEVLKTALTSLAITAGITIAALVMKSDRLTIIWKAVWKPFQRHSLLS